MSDAATKTESMTVPVPLPTEIPLPPDLSMLPAHILHSGTVETLIGQNDDLMARLKVNIRRNSVLEQQLMETERINSEITQVNTSLVAQVQILQEKYRGQERLMHDVTSRVDDQQDTLRTEIALLETRAEALEERNSQLRSAARFQRRVRRWVAPAVKKMRDDLTNELRLRLTRETQASDLRERLAEAVTHVQTLLQKTGKDQSQLVEQYETRIRQLENGESGKRIELENRIVALERKNQSTQKSLGEEIQKLQEQVVQYRKEAKVLAVDVVNRDVEKEKTTSELSQLREEHGRLLDQFESLQTVWADAQKRLETGKLQQETLNRLNQELSRQLKMDRLAGQPDAPSTSQPIALPNVVSARNNSPADLEF
jgi:DNA repair exonuclease SbcCD ATPase subunit